MSVIVAVAVVSIAATITANVLISDEKLQNLCHDPLAAAAVGGGGIAST